MKTILVVLTFFAISAQAESTTIYKCNINEAFDRQMPSQVILLVGEKTANIESNKLKNCHPIKDLSGEQNSLTGSVTCDSGTIDMKFDVLFKPEINSEINLTLSGDDYSYSELGEANYICKLKPVKSADYYL